MATTPYLLATIAGLSIVFGALLYYAIYAYIAIFLVVIFSGYFVFGIFKHTGNRFYFSLILVSSVLIGGAIGFHLDSLFNR